MVYIDGCHTVQNGHSKWHDGWDVGFGTIKQTGNNQSNPRLF